MELEEAAAKACDQQVGDRMQGSAGQLRPPLVEEVTLSQPPLAPCNVKPLLIGLPKIHAGCSALLGPALTTAGCMMEDMRGQQCQTCVGQWALN